jgi:Type II secretion system (T2SS), protein E, N-terminal domain
MAAALRSRLGLPVVEVGIEPVDPDALAEVTRELAARHLVIPLELTRTHGRKVLRVAMANPLDLDAIEDLAYASNARIEPAIATPSAIVEALAYHYRTSVTKVLREAPGARALVEESTSPNLRASPGPDAPETAPYHRVADEASVELRLTALLNLLIARGILDEDALHEEIRRLMKDAAGR